MKMTAKLANELMNNLICVAISANGGVSSNGLTENQLALVQKYAKIKFQDILTEWEDLFNKQWEIIE